MSVLATPTFSARADCDALLATLNLCAAVATKREGLMPLLQFVKIEASGAELHIEATDLDVTLQIACAAEIEEVGSFVVHLETLLSFLKSAPDNTVSFSVDQPGWVNVTSGTAKFRYPTREAQDFPVLPIEDVGAVHIETSVLADALNGTVYCVGDDVRFNLRGVFFTACPPSFELCAADGYRFAVATTDSAWGATMSDLIPTKAARLLAKISAEADVAIRVATNHTYLTFSDGTVVSYRRQDVNFPKYRHLIPSAFDNRLLTQRDRLIQSVRRVLSLTTDADRGLRCSVADGRLTIRPKRAERGEGSDYVSVDSAGKFEFSMNGTRLKDALETVGGEMVLIGFTEKVITLEPGEQEPPIEYQHFLIPLV